jgi:hypothetical protein
MPRGRKGKKEENRLQVINLEEDLSSQISSSADDVVTISNTARAIRSVVTKVPKHLNEQDILAIKNAVTVASGEDPSTLLSDLGSIQVEIKPKRYKSSVSDLVLFIWLIYLMSSSRMIL